MLPIISIDTILQKSYLNKIWFFIMDLSPLSMFKYSIKNHPLCECGNDSYTKKITFLVHNVVVQATNIIKKGDFIAKNKNYSIQASTNSTGTSIRSAASSGGHTTIQKAPTNHFYIFTNLNNMLIWII